MVRKLHTQAFCIVVASMMLLSCNSTRQSETSTAASKIIYQPEFAGLFSVVEVNGNRSLVFRNPNLNGDNDTLIIDTNNLRIAALSATHSAFLAEIGAENLIKAVDNCSFHGHRAMIDRCSSGEIFSFGETNYINPEILFKHKINYVTISGFDNKPQWSANAARVGISTLRIWEWKETHPLGKAEWLVAFGYLVGKEQRALEIFRNEVKNYTRLANRKSKNNIKVFAGNPYQGVWYCPKEDSYLSQLFKDAGWIYGGVQTGVGSASLSNEEAILKLQESQVWIYHGSCKDMACIYDLEPRLSNIGSVKKQIWAPIKLLQEDGRNPFWDYGTMYPSNILNDFIEIGNNQEEQTTYYKALR